MVHKNHQLLLDLKWQSIRPLPIGKESNINVPQKIYTQKKISWKNDAILTGVPFTTVDTWPGAVPSVSGIGASRDNPKSATFAVNLESTRILLAFISRWKIGGSASVCRYSMPLAAPNAMRNLIGNLKGSLDLAVT